MQLFSLPPAAIPASSGLPGDAAPWLIAAWIVLSQVFAILGHWIASKVVVGDERARFVNAVKVWGLYIAVVLILAIALGVVIGVGVYLENKVSALFMMAGWILLLIGLGLYVPAKIYDIGLFRSLGFILLSGIISGAATAGADRVAGLGITRRDALVKISGGQTENPWSRLQVLLGQKDEIDALLDDASAAAKSNSPEQRQAALRAIRGKLEARHKSLPASDEPAKVTYTAQQERYQALVDALRGDMSKTPAW